MLVKCWQTLPRRLRLVRLLRHPQPPIQRSGQRIPHQPSRHCFLCQQRWRWCCWSHRRWRWGPLRWVLVLYGGEDRVQDDTGSAHGKGNFLAFTYLMMTYTTSWLMMVTYSIWVYESVMSHDNTLRSLCNIYLSQFQSSYAKTHIVHEIAYWLMSDSCQIFSLLEQLLQ